MRKARQRGVPFVIVRMECRGHLMRVMGFTFDLMMYRPFGSVLGKSLLIPDLPQCLMCFLVVPSELRMIEIPL